MSRLRVPCKIPDRILRAFEEELTSARQAAASQDFPEAWRRLERAHVLGQAWNGPHARVHLGMMDVSLRQRDIGKLERQTLILLSDPLATALVRGLVGASGQNVNPLRRGPVPSDLADILRLGVQEAAG